MRWIDFKKKEREQERQKTLRLLEERARAVSSKNDIASLIKEGVYALGEVDLEFGFTIGPFVEGAGQYSNRYCRVFGKKIVTAKDAKYDGEMELLNEGIQDCLEDIRHGTDLSHLRFDFQSSGDKKASYLVSLL